MTAVLKTIAPGFFTTVQDCGRYHYRHVGVPVAGALDRDGFMLANALVGNDLNAACLELAGSGPEFEVVASSVRLALVGGADGLETKGRDEPFVRAGQTVRLTKGEIVRIRLGNDAFCSYLAIEGGFDVPLCLGSRSTYTRAGFGGFSGRPLQSGDVLQGATGDVPVRNEVMLKAPRKLRVEQPIRVVLGPQDDSFTKNAIEQLLSGTYKITPASDRMGFRLEGPLLEHKGDYNLVSDGIVPGSIQVPGSKLPIILMADAQTTGGYPKIATVISADLPVLGVRRAGRTVQFKAVSRDEAETIRRDEHKRLLGIIEEICPVGDFPNLNIDSLYSQNLIDGVIDAASH